MHRSATTAEKVVISRRNVHTENHAETTGASGTIVVSMDPANGGSTGEPTSNATIAVKRATSQGHARGHSANARGNSANADATDAER